MKCPRCSHEFVERNPWSPLFGETLKRVIDSVCEVYATNEAALMSLDRHKTIAEARCVAMWFAREHTGLSYPELGRAFSNRDHTTIIHAVRRISADRHWNKLLAERMRAVAARSGLSVERVAAE